MPRGGGGRGGGRRGGGGGGYGRRDARPGGSASRDDRDRRPDYRSRRTPSPGRRPRRPRGEDDDRAPPRGGRTGYGSGGRSPPRRERTDYGDRHQSPRRGRVEHEDPRDLPGRGPRDYGGDRRGSPRGRREYGGDPNVSPRGLRDYGRGAYRGERDRYDRPGRDGYDAPPSYMLPDHPSDLGRPSRDRSILKDDYLGAGPGHRSTTKDGDLFGGGMTLKISASGLGRTSTMYPQDPRSPPLPMSPPRTVLSPPLYPSVPPETGFLTGGSSMKAGDGFGAGSNPLLRDDGHFKYHKHSHDPYSESRGIEKHYSGSRDVAVEKDGRTERFYSSGDVPVGRDRETGRIYSSRDVLESDMVKALGDSSSALLAKDHPHRMYTGPGYESSNGYIMDGLGRSTHGSIGYVSGHPHRLSGSSLDHGSGHGDETLLDIARQTHSKHAPRAASMEYDGHAEYVGRDPINDAYDAPEASLRGARNETVNHHLRVSHRIEEDDCSFESAHKETQLMPHFRDDSIKYPTRGGNGRYSHSPGTEPIRTVGRSSRQDYFSSIDNLSDQEAYPMVSRKRYRSPEFDHEIDLYPADDGFAGLDPYDDDMDAYDLPPPRMPIYDSDMVDDDDYDERYDMPTNQNVFSRLALPHETYGYGHSKNIPISQRLSRPNSYSQFGGASMNGRGRGRGRGLTKSAKKRLRTAPYEFHGEYTSGRNECDRPNKFSKSSEDDPNGSEMKHEDAPEYEDLLRKDPPEGSEEFRKQVDQAFLKYTKILNESPAMQKKYREASKGSLSCSVCGSVARKFPDLDALLSHAYDTCKTGLRTKHLGFHRALCILMGWNWQVAPDTSKAHHSISSEEVNAMRGDLMLWPPVVVIHNSSIVKAKDIEAKVVSVEEIEGVLADIGIPLEKAKVSHGRPANQSVFLVKFQPTISGFQEAMRTHDHFSTRNHGKEELQQMRDGKGKKAALIDNLEELLYGHVAVAEDLVYLDEGTKKRCIIRSKMEIEANADATLNLEP